MDGNVSQLQDTKDHIGVIASASLFEGDFSIDWLVELHGEKTSEILHHLENGVANDLLIKKERGFFSFKSLNKKQRIENLLDSRKLPQLHQKIADILIRELAEDRKKAQTIAYHLLKVNNNKEGCHWLVKAGDQYLSTFLVEEALRCYAKPLDDLSGCSSKESDLLFTETAIKYAKISTARYNTKKVLLLLKDAAKRAKTHDLKSSLALLEMHIAKNEWLQFRYPSALRHFKKGWSIVEELKEPKLFKSANVFRISYLYWLGRYKEVLSVYESFVGDVDNYPIGRFPLLALMIVGRCYAQSGHFTQGVGMLDAIRTHCNKRGDRYLSAQASGALGAVMLDNRNITEAIDCLRFAVDAAISEHNQWIHLSGSLSLAYAYFLSQDEKQSIAYLREFIRLSRKVNVIVPDFPYLLDLSWAMEEGKLPYLPDISFRKELHEMMKSKNIFIRGVSYKYNALSSWKLGEPQKSTLKSFKTSLKLLKQSGHQIEVVRTNFEMIRYYLSIGEQKTAEKIASDTSDIVSCFSPNLIPNDLRPIIQNPKDQNLLEQILRTSQKVVTIHENKDLFQYIISAVNRIAGAERGAIFLLDGGSKRLQLRASKNLTSDQINEIGFEPSMQLIKKVSKTGKGRLQMIDTNENFDKNTSDHGCSRIAVPMIYKGRITGVLYHDNQLLRSAFKESDLDLLSYFATLAAFALENAKAYDEIRLFNQRLKEEKLYYEREHLQSLHFNGIVGESMVIRMVLSQIKQVAATDSAVLIVGETGVGKELVARSIHQQSPRRNKSFIRVLCNALSEHLIPSELFGHEEGAFTGARHRRIGRFELADGGTIFLDEIGNLPIEIQVKLLRVLETKEFERVGGIQTLHSDFRLIAATNRDIEKEVRDERFRADLFYRINVFPILVPPLRDRKGDIPRLAYHFLKLYSEKMQKKINLIPEEEMDKLLHYDWPGNVRELQNIIERGIILSSEPLFKVPELSCKPLDNINQDVYPTIRENEYSHILGALEKTNWKVRGSEGAAELLNIHPSTLESRMKKLGIKRPQKAR